MKEFVAIVIMLFILPAVDAQGIKYVYVKLKPMSYAPVNFYIKNVVDERADTVGIGMIDEDGKKQKTDIAGGIIAYLDTFTFHDASTEETAPAIVLHIFKLNFDIKKINKTWTISATANFCFYNGDNQLIEYATERHTGKCTNISKYIDNFIRQTLENDFKKFDPLFLKNHAINDTW